MHRTRTSAVPAMRTHDLVTTESKDEVLVYDQEAHHIHHLNASAATVWRLCDGERTADEIAVEAGLTQDAVKLALRTLEDAKLLDGALASEMRGTQSRRTFAKKAGIAAIPAIVSITAPIAKAAASNHPTCDPLACTTNQQVNCCTTQGEPGLCSGSGANRVCNPIP
jgi:hypothetical protein